MTSAISSSVWSRPSRRRLAVASFGGGMRAGRPPTLPLARAAATLAAEHSITTSRSNWASAENACRSLLGEIANLCPTPLARRQGRPGAGTERPNRSRRHTTRVSPRRRWSKTRESSGRSVRDAEAVSDHTRLQPAVFKSSSCMSNRWSTVEILAYPSRSPTRRPYQNTCLDPWMSR